MKKYKIYVQRVGNYTVIADRINLGSYSIVFYKKGEIVSVCPTALTVIETIEDYIEPEKTK